jgi:hypothetical protein
MAVRKYYRAILDTLEGRTEELQAVPLERRDWAGSGALLDLYHRTAGGERTTLIRAIGDVLEAHPTSAGALAQLVNLATGLDLAEVEPQVRKLQAEDVARKEPLSGAIRNYLAFRSLNAPTPAAMAASDPKRPAADGGRRPTGGVARQARKTSA